MTVMDLSDNTFKRLAEHMSDMVALHDPDGCYRWVSPSVKRILGYSPDELIGTSPYKLFHPDDMEAIAKNTHEPAVDGEGNILIRYRIRRSDGEYIWFETLTQPILNDDGEVVELHTSSRDVTRQHQLEEALAANEALYRAGLDSLEEGVVVHGADGEIIAHNPQALTILGLTSEELLDRVPRDPRWHAVYPDGTPFPAEQHPAMVSLRTGEPCSHVLMGVHNPKWQERRWISINSQPTHIYYQADAERAAVVVSFEDVTDRLNRENQLKLWSTVYQASGEAIVIVDVKGAIQDVNESFTRVVKADKSCWIGKPIADITQSTRSDGKFDSTIWPALNKEGIWRGELWLRDSDGGVQPSWAAMTRVQQELSDDILYTLILSDFSERSRREEQLKHHAGHDYLTGLPNRVLLNDRFDVALKTAGRLQTTFACLYLDLDGFKPVNDQHGHAVGDLVLQQVAKRISDVVRSMDTVSRIGGDEFVILIFGLENEADYTATAERISRSINQPMTVEGTAVTVGASIGVALYPKHGLTQAALIAASDSAMYVAKRQSYSVSSADSDSQPLN